MQSVIDCLTLMRSAESGEEWLAARERLQNRIKSLTDHELVKEIVRHHMDAPGFKSAEAFKDIHYLTVVFPRG
ncbi:MAG: hypothetical protein HY291_16185 [Planctomycetes bacterium]|nr:hypothetical protein [Planctomycetota bacterium]